MGLPVVGAREPARGCARTRPALIQAYTVGRETPRTRAATESPTEFNSSATGGRACFFIPQQCTRDLAGL